ncbi:hypothetical protein IRJ41_008626 [Triplophysa rosa]|uniref:Uncharacterized protein n=1 Tax=Triplophysa rosa TaxID=992332 RepID=A0A9W7WQF5_TRIRA|nr:hypothetical protein IRJ41_008626 [Triplophysa rosa]
MYIWKREKYEEKGAEYIWELESFSSRFDCCILSWTCIAESAHKGMDRRGPLCCCPHTAAVALPDHWRTARDRIRCTRTGWPCNTAVHLTAEVYWRVKASCWPTCCLAQLELCSPLSHVPFYILPSLSPRADGDDQGFDGLLRPDPGREAEKRDSTAWGSTVMGSVSERRASEKTHTQGERAGERERERKSGGGGRQIAQKTKEATGEKYEGMEWIEMDKQWRIS